ncbi:MAG: hypothetical protein LKJ57_04065 [Ancrocorticia sp.]|jgi:hypothetical protein|nr:hypothetical protein [Ancrocorticia sp.]MCI1933404.1 hypothetical protein [Ancrocorticia sp.]MCI1962531.1 hypothetical protein [Ancrocorticia sp.]MCI2002539.1 hypothetical protein [Ancrocorticia sp.]MCI2012761.1 hypothetical protein [Ancrocorticia sp.]
MILESAQGAAGPQATDTWEIAQGLNALAAHPEAARVPTHTFAAQCIDGRPAAGGDDLRVPRTAGGTVTAWVIDLLANDAESAFETAKARHPVATDVPHADRIREAVSAAELDELTALARELRGNGFLVFGHSDDHATGTISGCGAADNLAHILRVFATAQEPIAELLSEWTIDASLIPRAAQQHAMALADTLPNGRQIIGALAAIAPNPLPVLVGKHAEIAVVANGAPNTTIDVAAAAAAIGWAGSRVFVVDTWAFTDIAEVVYQYVQRREGPHSASQSSERLQWHPTREEIHACIAGFNAATLLVLCNSSMPTVYLPA